MEGATIRCAAVRDNLLTLSRGADILRPLFNDLSSTPGPPSAILMSTASGIRVQTWAARSRGWIGIFLLAPFCVAVLFSKPLTVEGSWLDCMFDQIAWLTFLIGGAIRWWSTLYIGGRKTSDLISEGPYSLCRNPLYLGTFLMVVSVAIFMQSLTFSAGLILASWIYLSTTIPVEERRLRDRFGSKFDKYCEEVPRLFPRFSGFKSAATIEVRINGLMSEGIRTARWIWLPLICSVVVQLRSEANWPHFFKLP
jgi:protein-S-isoprenylcysteine O-methyltransferase Ste14